MKISLPSTKKGRVWLGVGAFVGVVSVFGTINDATAPATDHQYKVCMEAYHDAKHCYDDVYRTKGGDASTSPSPAPSTPPATPPPAPTDIPVPIPAPTEWNPLPAQHFFFYPDADLDASQVEDLR
jgi:hypothetical protein